MNLVCEFTLLAPIIDDEFIVLAKSNAEEFEVNQVQDDEFIILAECKD